MEIMFESLNIIIIIIKGVFFKITKHTVVYTSFDFKIEDFKIDLNISLHISN